MKNIVVVGANYGDEGKGIITARIAKQYADKNILNILTNGGSQRGHTVKNSTTQHIFQHFGSATFGGATTYYPPEFILNPMQFVKEYGELRELNVRVKRPIASFYCRWSTPFDMMANQISQLNNWTGSCGYGIWNTIIRYSNFVYKNFFTFCESSFEEQKEFLNKVKEYYENKLTEIPIEYKDSWNSENLIVNFINDCEFMYSMVRSIKLDVPVGFDVGIFESGQGLLLSDKGIDDKDTTPSITGMKNHLLYKLKNPEIHYVTRPYVTRHGSSEFLGKGSVDSDLNKSTETNTYNQFQRDFNYGNLDISSLKERIENDCLGKNYILEVTHCDELDREKEFKEKFANVNFYDNPRI